MKKFIAGFLTCLVLMSGFYVLAESQQWTALRATFDVYVNGKKFESDKPIVAIEGSTYLPLKAIGDVLGVPVQWNEKLIRVEVGSISNTKNEYSFNNPAPLNTIQTITKESFLQKYTAEVVVKEIVRGETANKMVADANIFNDPPKEGYEYLLAKVYVKLISIDEGALTLSPLQFSLISSDGKEYDMPFVVLPEPEITTTLYPGASHEGWVVFEVKKDDLKPKIVFEKQYDGTGGAWFKGWVD